MNSKPLPVGVDNFEKLITRGYYFIDKTTLIKELLDKKGDVNLFTRPRRFGKTLNMSMLQYFFEDARNDEGEKLDYSYLFEGLLIMQEGEQYLSCMGQYPVISLTLKSAKQPNFSLALRALTEDIAGEYRRHFYICKKDCLQTYEKEKFIRFMEEKTEDMEYHKSLQFLSQCLEKYHGKKAIILIDEYDVPLENAHMHGFYSEMSAFIRSLFESSLKTNSSLEFAVITGCLRISKESIFTGMNNLKIISILNKQYDEYFGFTDTEVAKICEDYHMTQKMGTLKEWYNGYLFGDTDVYNPWSVIQLIDDWCEDKNQYPKAYWANTSSNSIVRKLIEAADEDAKMEIEELIEGKSIEKPIHEDITYDEIYKTMDNLWNFMFFTGYFRKVRERMDENDNRYVELIIPNREVKYIFRTKVLGWFDEQVKARDRSRLFTALVNLDAEVVEEEIVDMLLETISFNDAYESFYHGFLAGILSGMKGYVVKSNREGGTGRSDLFIKPVTRRKPAYVLEFKVANKFHQLDEAVDEALSQIEDRGYVRELEDDGYATVYKYGIAFCGKDCKVKLE